MTRKELLAAIRRWKSQNELAAHARELALALAGIDDWETRERVGYALRDVPREAFGEAFSEARIAIVGNSTLDGLDHLLRARLLEHGIWPDFYQGGFDQYVRELFDPESGLYRYQAGLTLCVLEEHVVAEAVERAWQLDAVAQELDAKYAMIERLVDAFSAHSSGTLALTLPALSAETLASVIDYRGKARLGALWRDFQRRLLALAETHSRVLVLDTDVLLHGAGAALRDARLAFHGAMFLSQALLDALAGEVVGVVRALAGRSKKCLMLDLDDTLWGGILGEVGAAGLELGESAQGKAHRELQRIARGFKEQGVLLTINSKNELSNVLGVLDGHPELGLRSSDFVAIEANWQPKHQNTRRIAETLNLGADSFVFLDDNEFERRLVSESVPGVSAPVLSGDATAYPSILLRGGWFNVLALTAEDRERTSLYQREARRDELKAAAVSFDEYLTALAIEIDLVVPEDELRLARLAQLGQRTNQFNLTGHRHQAGELRSMVSDERFLVLGIKGRDRFGEYGLVGGVVVEKTGPKLREWWIRSFLLSCRVFERGIECAALRSILDDARAAGASAVYGEFVPSKKNVRFETFYTSQGFARVEAEGAGLVYRHGLDVLPAPVPWISTRSTREGVAA
jgi:FkbH-like protein